MSNFQQQGEISHISERRQVSDKFTVRDLVIRTKDQYPQIIIFQLTNAKCDLVDNLRKGETVNVHFNLRGREWTSPQGEVKYFNTLDAWNVELVPLEQATGSHPQPATATSQPAAATPTDGLPF